jgi:hypothetical protein
VELLNRPRCAQLRECLCGAERRGRGLHSAIICGRERARRRSSGSPPHALIHALALSNPACLIHSRFALVKVSN